MSFLEIAFELGQHEEWKEIKRSRDHEIKRSGYLFDLLRWPLSLRVPLTLHSPQILSRLSLCIDCSIPQTPRTLWKGGKRSALHSCGLLFLFPFASLEIHGLLGLSHLHRARLLVQQSCSKTKKRTCRRVAIVREDDLRRRRERRRKTKAERRREEGEKDSR